MTVFAESATFSFTALHKGGVLWNQQGREENGKESGSRTKSEIHLSYQFSKKSIILLGFDLFVKILRPSGLGYNHGEFDPGSERTLAARLKHASRTNGPSGPEVADG